jgi:hypothetical protein
VFPVFTTAGTIVFIVNATHPSFSAIRHEGGLTNGWNPFVEWKIM